MDALKGIYIMIYQWELLTRSLNAVAFMVRLIIFKKIIAFKVRHGNSVVVLLFYKQHMTVILIAMCIIYYHRQIHPPYLNDTYQ